MKPVTHRRELLCLALLAPWASACTEVRSGGPIAPPPSPEVAELERQLLELLLGERQKQGLDTLERDAELDAVARAHSVDMRDGRFFAHDSPHTGTLEDRLDRAGQLALVARENLGEGPDPERTHAGLMASPGHRANILAGDVTHVGIGVVRGGVADPANLLVTQVFATKVTALSTDEARGELVQRIDEARKQKGLPGLPRDARLDELAAWAVAKLPDDLVHGRDTLDRRWRGARARPAVEVVERVARLGGLRTPSPLLRACVAAHCRHPRRRARDRAWA
jgi:uncharacterized protein YkwD